MKAGLAIALISTLLFSVLVSARSAPRMPEPGLEHKKLNYFVGDWSLVGQRRPSAVGPGGKFTLTEHNEWMEGGFFLINRGSAKTQTGNGTSLGIMGYDSDQKTYTYHIFTSGGEHEFSRGTLEGDTWTWKKEEITGREAVRERYTVKQLSPTSYTFEFAIAKAWTDWSIVNQGNATKTK
jgi:hypothetical protein